MIFHNKIVDCYPLKNLNPQKNFLTIHNQRMRIKFIETYKVRKKKLNLQPKDRKTGLETIH